MSIESNMAREEQADDRWVRAGWGCGASSHGASRVLLVLRAQVSRLLVFRILVCGLLLVVVGSSAWGQASGPDEALWFDQQIAPILARHCIDCHSGAQPKGKLDLSTHTSAIKGGESGAVIVAGQPDKSLLWELIDSKQMPPKRPLGEEDQRKIKQWIERGAKWGTERIEPGKLTTEFRAGNDWWSLQPVRQVAVPQVEQDGRQVTHPVDAFIVERLRSIGLTPSPSADKRTLLRRVTFDLTGLPPTLEETQQFLSDTREDAYERLVDRLLRSPHYGERLARMWLDVVRFGESNGFEYDEPRDNFWPYRNWVIQALNSDMPYDEFVRCQIAGDAIAPDDIHMAAATGFLVAGPHNTTLPSNTKMRMAMAQEELEDLVGTVGQTFLGLTVHCARCHDHKFDPISQKEYYQLAAALAGATHGQRTLSVSLSAEQEQRLQTIAKELETKRVRREQIIEPVRQQLLKTREADRARAGKTNVSKADVATPDVGKPHELLPEPIAWWEFDGDLKDSVGSLDLTASGGAHVADGGLVLDGKQAFATSAKLSTAIAEKTLEAWVKLDNLQQRGGGVISLETIGGARFDAIVYGEQEAKKWLAGSNNFVRTRSFQSKETESEAHQRAIHVAWVYQADGTITAYRDGQLYGTAYDSGELSRFEANGSHVLIGLRHSPSGGNRLLAGRVERALLYDRALNANEVARSAAERDAQHLPAAKIREALPAELVSELDAIEKQLELLDQERKSIEAARRQTLYSCVSGKPGETRVLIRGDVSTPGEVVEPRGLSALSSIQADFKPAASSSASADTAQGGDDRSRRLALARWITDKQNPLFTRVIVNRLWQFHFGQGLVATPSDLGFNGGQPSHPELLDWLTSQLIRDGYRLKALHRLIVTSATYRQSSRDRAEARLLDADNRWLWRKNPVRLEAEALRDAMLVVADRLDRQIGGTGYRDMRHYFYKGSHFYDPLEEDCQQPLRRTIYRFTPRGGHNLFLDTFDCPDPSAAAPRRAVTTTPLQALALLNNALVFDLSDAFAMRVRERAGEELPRQIDAVYESAYGRVATQAERERGCRFVEAEGLPALCRVIFNSNEFLTVQ